MIKKIGLLFWCGIMMMGMIGCSKEEKPRYALIENTMTTENQLCSEAAWEGVVSYAQTMAVGCERYKAEGDTRKDYAAVIDQAVDEGAKVIVCVGEEMEVPVCEAQRAYRGVNFLLLNAEPHKRFAKKTNLEENTVALHFNETQQGYALGYTAVMSGYRNIGCMGGAETEKNLKIAAGFVQGVEAAGKELGLAEGDIQLSYTFMGVDKLSPIYMSRAMDWYANGCEAIFALEEGVLQSVVEATKLQEGVVISTNGAAALESEKIVTAAIVDYAGAVKHQIELIENEQFIGDQVLNCGIKEKGVSLITGAVTLSDNTLAQYNTMCKKLEEGTLTIEETMVVPPTKVTTVIKE